MDGWRGPNVDVVGPAGRAPRRDGRTRKAAVLKIHRPAERESSLLGSLALAVRLGIFRPELLLCGKNAKAGGCQVTWARARRRQVWVG